MQATDNRGWPIVYMLLLIVLYLLLILLHVSMKPISWNTAPWIGFDSTVYDFNEGSGVATLQIITNTPENFTDATGALLYTTDGITTNNEGIV